MSAGCTASAADCPRGPAGASGSPFQPIASADKGERIRSRSGPAQRSICAPQCRIGVAGTVSLPAPQTRVCCPCCAAASDGGKNNVSQLTSSVPSRRDVPAEAADDDLHPSTRGGADARPPADALRSMSHSARILFKSVSDRVLGGGRRRKARDAVLGKVLAEIRSLAGLIEENERGAGPAKQMQCAYVWSITSRHRLS